MMFAMKFVWHFTMRVILLFFHLVHNVRSHSCGAMPCILSLFFPASFFPSRIAATFFYFMYKNSTWAIRSFPFFSCARFFLSPSLSITLFVYLCARKFRHCWCAKDDRMMNKVYIHTHTHATNTYTRSAIHFKQKWLTAVLILFL